MIVSEGERRHRKKEMAKKMEQEAHLVVEEENPKKEDETGVEVRREQPVVPSVEVPDTLVQVPANVGETSESSKQPESEDEENPYTPAWDIYPSTQMRLPLERAEWVAQALPPAEMAVFAEAKVFDICDLANRAAVLATVSENSIQQLLCEQNTQVKKWKAEVTEHRLSKARVDWLIGDSLRREQNLSHELDPLREQAGQVPELEGS